MTRFLITCVVWGFIWAIAVAMGFEITWKLALLLVVADIFDDIGDLLKAVAES